MTADEFNELFAAEDLAEIQAAMQEAEIETAAATPEPTAPPVKDGVWYVEDVEDANGHQISWYRLAGHGKTLLWFSIDNEISLTAEELGGHLPCGITGHAIRVWSGDRMHSIGTKGFAARAPHPDGAVHLDGQTVRSYVVPRASRWIAEFYGV